MFNVNYEVKVSELMKKYPTLEWVDYGMGVNAARDVEDGFEVERVIKPVDGPMGMVPTIGCKIIGRVR